jgi:hypothetical protein
MSWKNQTISKLLNASSKKFRYAVPFFLTRLKIPGIKNFLEASEKKLIDSRKILMRHLNPEMHLFIFLLQ